MIDERSDTAKELDSLLQPIVLGVLRIRSEIREEVEKIEVKGIKERAELSLREVALNDVLAKLDALLPEPDKIGFSTLPKEEQTWPWGRHETNLLRKMAEVAKQRWALYDPSDASTAPKNTDVVALLVERGVTERIAQSMATILRANDLPAGRRR